MIISKAYRKNFQYQNFPVFFYPYTSQGTITFVYFRKYGLAHQIINRQQVNWSQIPCPYRQMEKVSIARVNCGMKDYSGGKRVILYTLSLFTQKSQYWCILNQ